jgi:hypothetical protein
MHHRSCRWARCQCPIASSDPPCFQALREINAILCHQPWMLTVEHINGLLSIDIIDGDSGEHNCWSVSELVQAIVIMVSTHALSSFVWGLGVAPDPGEHWHYHVLTLSRLYCPITYRPLLYYFVPSFLYAPFFCPLLLCRYETSYIDGRTPPPR